MLKRKVCRRSSAQYYVSAEDHVENEVKHERLLTESSRLSSSWTGLSISCSDSTDCLSSSSANNSPIYRTNSFSGPLVISVTCTNACHINGNIGCKHFSTNSKSALTTSTHFSKSLSCHPSPVASPVSLRTQCYSPGLRNNMDSPNPRRHTGSEGASLFFNTVGRKRGYLACNLGTSYASSDDASREGSPDVFVNHRSIKSFRQEEPKFYGNVVGCVDCSNFRWPPGSSTSQSPSSPLCHLFSSVVDSTISNSPLSPSLCVSSPSCSMQSVNLVNGTDPITSTESNEHGKNLFDSSMEVELKSNVEVNCLIDPNMCIYSTGT